MYNTPMAEMQVLAFIHVLALVAGSVVAYKFYESTAWALAHAVFSAKDLTKRRFEVMYEIMDQPKIFEYLTDFIKEPVAYIDFLRSYEGKREEVRAKYKKEVWSWLRISVLPVLPWLFMLMLVFQTSIAWVFTGFIITNCYFMTTYLLRMRQKYSSFYPMVHTYYLLIED